MIGGGKNIGRYCPLYSKAGKMIGALVLFIAQIIGRCLKFYTIDGRYGQKVSREFLTRIGQGETLYVIGIVPSGHNSTVALVEVSMKKGINVLCNNEEERYTGIKNDSQFPKNSLGDVVSKMKEVGLAPKDIFLVVSGWDYIRGIATFSRLAVEEAPAGFNLIRKKASPPMNFWHFVDALKTPVILRDFLKLHRRVPVIGMRHHNNHAFYSYAMSPFANSKDPVMINVMDGFGDDGSISHFLAQDGEVKLTRKYSGIMDSQGLLYAVISSTQGGWEPLSSEGRYMGASSWGNMNRLTNPYYKQLRQVLYFNNDGRVYVNRSFIGYHRYGQIKPYARNLKSILGEPIPPEELWNPDVVLDVERIKHAPVTKQRVDKAAALQLIYEDALFHMVDYLIRKTGSHKLILSGGTALNCIANMKLLEHFDKSYYERTLNKKDVRLNIWVPPNPSDTGTAMGAVFHFAMLNKVCKCAPMKDAFICGNPPQKGEVQQRIAESRDVEAINIGNVSKKVELARIADLLAFIISHDGIIGIYQGTGETGPRALGHRSIYANPCNPNTLRLLNDQVKYRERIRPLAPIVTLEEAKRFFYLSEGAAMDNYNAYNYMVLTVKAKEESRSVIPSVIHIDGTSRIQICREETDPLSFAVLKHLKRYLGVEMAVNTSLNVGTPIVHSPGQAIEALYRSKGLTALVMVDSNGEAYMVWHKLVKPPKDGGKKLMEWYKEWKETRENKF